jgi:phosphodiesterase/alkaline phosphatase D-like protein
MDDMGIFGSGASGDGSEAGVSRRMFLSGVVVVGAAAGLAGVADGAFTRQAAFAATAPSGPPTTTLPLPTTTAPEQLWLTWGKNPAKDVTVSWLAPGTVAQPAPTLAYSRSPIGHGNPGRVIQLPEPKQLDVSKHYPRASSVSFTDGLNAQTTFVYHVELRDLEPGTRYYYQVSDGAATPPTASASF